MRELRRLTSIAATVVCCTVVVACGNDESVGVPETLPMTAEEIDVAVWELDGVDVGSGDVGGDVSSGDGDGGSPAKPAVGDGGSDDGGLNDDAMGADGAGPVGGLSEEDAHLALVTANLACARQSTAFEDLEEIALLEERLLESHGVGPDDFAAFEARQAENDDLRAAVREIFVANCAPG